MHETSDNSIEIVSDENVEVFKIEVGSKYIISLQAPAGFDMRQAEAMSHQLKGALEEWMKKEDDFFFIMLTFDGTEIYVGKVDCEDSP